MGVYMARRIDGRSDVKKGIASVRRRLRSFGNMDFYNAELAKPSMHLLKEPGKLIRPVLVLESANALGRKPQEFVDLSVAIELLHISSLLHDDIIDRDVVRRGIETVHMRYGEEAAILAGDALISKAVQESCKYGTDIVELISQSAMKMCAGEMLDYTYQKSKTVPSIDSYIDIARLKSGALISASVSAVAKYTGDKLYSKLSAFGVNVGIGFQIQDDVIDSLGLDTKNGTADLRKFRPNIISTLITHSRLRKEDAVNEAIELNNKYIDMAKNELEGVREFGGLVKYAGKIKLKRIR